MRDDLKVRLVVRGRRADDDVEVARVLARREGAARRVEQRARKDAAEGDVDDDLLRLEEILDVAVGVWVVRDGQAERRRVDARRVCIAPQGLRDVRALHETEYTAMQHANENPPRRTRSFANIRDRCKADAM